MVRPSCLLAFVALSALVSFSQANPLNKAKRGYPAPQVHQALTRDQQQKIVDYHNKMRKETKPPAQNMPDLTWDDTLAQYAMNWAQCGSSNFFVHSYGRYGENLYVVGGGSMQTAEEIDIVIGTLGPKMWWVEYKDYDYDTNSCATGKQCGHYTQMAWAKTTKIGCGYALNCPDPRSWNSNYNYNLYLVCSYDPPGNYIGQWPYEKLEGWVADPNEIDTDMYGYLNPAYYPDSWKPYIDELNRNNDGSSTKDGFPQIWTDLVNMMEEHNLHFRDLGEEAKRVIKKVEESPEKKLKRLVNELAKREDEKRALESPEQKMKRLVNELEKRGSGQQENLALTSSQQQAIVDYHNKMRKQVNPTATDMKDLVWDDTVAQFAINWARCGSSNFFKHSHGQYGENLYVSGSSAPMSSSGISSKVSTDGAKSWWDEVNDYTYDTNSCAPGKQCGHYTQMAWADTTKIGCGYALNCPDAKSWGSYWTYNLYLVCDYDPPGNYRGQKPYTKGSGSSKPAKPTSNNNNNNNLNNGNTNNNNNGWSSNNNNNNNNNGWSSNNNNNGWSSNSNGGSSSFDDLLNSLKDQGFQVTSYTSSNTNNGGGNNGWSSSWSWGYKRALQKLKRTLLEGKKTGPPPQ